MLAKLQDRRRGAQPMPSILGVVEEQREKQNKWYCPWHTKRELSDQPVADPACECPKRWPWKDIPKVPHPLAAQQDAQWVKDSGLLALEDDDAAALAAQWSMAPRAPPLD